MKKTILSILIITFLQTTLLAQKNHPEYFDKEYIKSELIKVTDWQLKNYKKRALNSWTSAIFYIGAYSAWEATHSQSIYDTMISLGNTTNWEPSKMWSNADDIAICQVYIDLYRVNKQQKMVQPTIDTLSILMNKPYPAKDNQVCVWWWADALFMAPPTLVKMGITLNDPAYLKFTDKCYKESYDLLYNKKEQLFARDLKYVIKNDGKDQFEENGKQIFWSRGNGWVLAGLARILNELPADYSNRPFYMNLYKQMSKRIVSLQQEDGLWRSSLLDPNSNVYGEESGSALYCYALAWGVNNGFLKGEKYRSAVKKCWIGLTKCVNNDGRVGWVQTAGTAPTKILSSDSSELYGTGAFLLAGSEIIKLKN